VPDLCIVSGLAFGIDAHCHRAALRYTVPTVAVIASTLPDVTPAQNSALARDMIDNGGAIVSECHSNSKQTGDFYLSRNRIIAGMSEGTVVVEAPRESGALSTAEFASGYNRTVMAVPARATDETSYGSNSLITRQQAAAVCWGEDVIRALAWDLYVPEVGERPVTAKPGLTDDEQALLKLFPSGEPISADKLAELSGLGHTALASLLLTLELTKMVISRLPGGSYIKI
jgi:DNA processing protein